MFWLAFAIGAMSMLAVEAICVALLFGYLTWIGENQ